MEVNKMTVVTCCVCKTRLPLKVLKSNAGYYVGYFCPNCGPYDRVSGYYGNHKQAQEALDNNAS